MTASGAKTVARVDEPYYYPRYYLSSSGWRLLEVTDSDDEEHIRVLDLNGKQIADKRVQVGSKVLDFTGKRMLYRDWNLRLNRYEVRVWRIDENKVRKVVARNGIFGDFSADALVFDDRNRTQYKLTWSKLSRPAQGIWNSRMEPTAINPTGKRVVGIAWTGEAAGSCRSGVPETVPYCPAPGYQASFPGTSFSGGAGLSGSPRMR
ncbi:MAG: hypothetical protein HZY75_15765 [Nocardioidaceae bacterium]|nr:MAG: hypothetical protein HZY75_15765 [Nocardioidaceae bacterium]